MTRLRPASSPSAAADGRALAVDEDEDPHGQRQEQPLRVGEGEDEGERGEHQVDHGPPGEVLGEALPAQRVEADHRRQQRHRGDRQRGDRVAGLGDDPGDPDHQRVEREEGDRVRAGQVADVRDVDVVDRVPAGQRLPGLGLPALDVPVPGELRGDEQPEGDGHQPASRPEQEDPAPHQPGAALALGPCDLGRRQLGAGGGSLVWGVDGHRAGPGSDGAAHRR